MKYCYVVQYKTIRTRAKDETCLGVTIRSFIEFGALIGDIQISLEAL